MLSVVRIPANRLSRMPANRLPRSNRGIYRNSCDEANDQQATASWLSSVGVMPSSPRDPTGRLGQLYSAAGRGSESVRSDGSYRTPHNRRDRRVLGGGDCRSCRNKEAFRACTLRHVPRSDPPGVHQLPPVRRAASLTDAVFETGARRQGVRHLVRCRATRLTFEIPEIRSMRWSAFTTSSALVARHW